MYSICQSVCGLRLTRDFLSVSDHLIIVLDYLGNVILEKNSADLGVCYPQSVTFDRTGILWIGASIAVVNEKQTGQIHAINYSPEI